MRRSFFTAAIAAIFSLILFFQISWDREEAKPPTHEEMVARGKYLVDFGGCNDCHSPKIYTEMGPIPDTTRLLAGYFADEKLPKADINMIGPEEMGND